LVMFGDVQRCSVMFGDVRRCSAILSELQFTIVTVGSFSIAKRPRERISSSGRVPSFGRESILDHRSCCASLRCLLDSSVETSPGVVPTSPFRSTSSNSKDRSKVDRIALIVAKAKRTPLKESESLCQPNSRHFRTAPCQHARGPIPKVVTFP